MSDFSRYMDNYQTNWRRSSLENQEQGVQNGKQRPWILPRELWEQGLWAGIRDGAESLPAYLHKNSVQRHDGAHNLKSSWMLCANLYFPFREDRITLASFLRANIHPGIDTVDCVELEWAAEEAMLRPAALLGEPYGQRGSNQTSPDIAFIVNGGKGIILTEVKFTEHSFYPCSGRKRIYDNPAPRRCVDIGKVYKDPAGQCHMLRWAKGRRTNRKYWDYLKLTPQAFDTLKRCPAATSGYQLFRQHALAEALAQRGQYDIVISCIAYDERNHVLRDCLKGTGLGDFAADWGALFEGKARFATFTHQEWVRWVAGNSKANWQDWLDYASRRYGL